MKSLPGPNVQTAITEENSTFYLGHVQTSEHSCQGKKDSCSGQVLKPQSEHMKGLVTGYWRLDGIIRGGNVSGDDVDIYVKALSS